jgi:hypothetical protein
MEKKQINVLYQCPLPRPWQSLLVCVTELDMDVWVSRRWLLPGFQKRQEDLAIFLSSEPSSEGHISNMNRTRTKQESR